MGIETAIAVDGKSGVTKKTSFCIENPQKCPMTEGRGKKSFFKIKEDMEALK